MKLYKYVIGDRRDVLMHARIRFTQAGELNDPFDMQPFPEALFTQAGWERLTENIIADIGGPGFLMELKRRAREKAIEQAIGPRHLASRKTRRKLERVLKRDGIRRAQARLDREFEKRSVEDYRREGIEYLNRIMAQLRTEERKRAELLPEVIKKTIGALSLTTEPTNTAMWWHYAGQYKGFLLEFDGEHEFFNLRQDKDQYLYTLRRVTYSKEVYRPPGLDDPNGWLPWFFNKKKDWEYEQEWRLLKRLDEADAVINDIVYLFSLPPACITGIILGPAMPPEDKQQIAEMIHRDHRYQHVRIYQAEIALQEGKIVIKTFKEKGGFNDG